MDLSQFAANLGINVPTHYTPTTTPTPAPMSNTNGSAPVSTAKRIGAAIATKYQQVLPTIQGARAEELAKVLQFLDTSFGSNHILEYASIDSSDNNDLNGRVVLNVPAEAFFTESAGYFQLRAAWPELDDAGTPVIKITLNYRVDPNTGNNILLQAGGGNGDSSGWTNIASQRVSVQHLIEAGFFAPEAIAELLTFVSNNAGSRTAIKTLTPRSNVIIALRNTIVPLSAKTNSRNISTSKEAGSDAGIGMAVFHFSGATILAQLGGLLLSNEAKKAVSAKVGLNELMARYGMPVAQPDMGADINSGVGAANPLAGYV
jgi:hypothetical protein